MKRFNFRTAAAEPDPDGAPAGYGERTAEFNDAIGAEHLSGQLIELPPGKKSCPYHWETAKEEWLLVVFGTPTVRHPDGETQLREGDLVCFPVGPEGGHQVMNRSDATCRVVMFSNATTPNVIMYPDSNKLAVTAPGMWHVLPLDSAVDYWEGE